MRGVELGLTHLRMSFGVEPDGAHEAERLGDTVSQLLVALGLRAVLDEAEHPAMHVFQIGVAAGGEGAQQIERRRRLTIPLQLPARIGNARFRREGDVVDDIAAIGRQAHAIDRLQVGRARLGELTRHAAHFHDGRGGGEGHHHRHLKEHAEEVADIVGRVLFETLGAIAALKQERLTALRCAQRPFELSRFARKNQRRIFGELRLGFGERGRVRIGRALRDRLRPPAFRAPA